MTFPESITPRITWSRKFVASYRDAWETVNDSAPMRKLAVLTAVNAFGNGLFSTINAIYYTQVLGFSIAFVSVTLAVSTLIAISGDLISGATSDRLSPRPVLFAGLVLSGLAAVALTLISTQPAFVVVILLVSLGQGLCMSSNTALIRRVARGNPALARASLRSLLTVGVSFGAVAGAVVLGLGGETAFKGGLLTNAATFFVCALILRRIMVPGAPAAGPGRPRPVLPDWRFLVFSLCNGAIGLYLHVLPYALPLWIVLHHPQYIWLAGVAIAANSIGTAIFQVPASSGISSAASATSRLFIGAVLVGASYLFFTAGELGALGLLVAVGVFVAAHTLGEVLYTAGSMELLYRLAPEAQQGQYGAFYGISNGVMASLAPLVLGWAVASEHTTLPWFGLLVATCLLASGVFVIVRRSPEPA